MPDLSECRYCSEVSIAQGEDPIGTAGVAEQWLIIEVPRPWKKNLWQEKTAYQGIIKVVIELEKQKHDLSLRLMAIAPDKKYSEPDFIRLFYYLRPEEMFAKYEKHEYLVPSSQLISLVRAILLEPQKLEQFENNKQKTENIREILVCTHTHHDTACGRYGTPLYQKLKKNYASENLRIWHTSHFGGHRFAPTLIDFPSGRFWGHLKPELLDLLVYEQGDPRQLEKCYRGWAGLEKFAQIAEREIWIREGWEWFNYPKSGRIIAKDQGNIFKILLRSVLQLIPIKKAKFLLKLLDRNLRWVEVEITYFDPNNSPKQAYRTKVEMIGNITTANKSTKDMKLSSVSQYSVMEIEKK